MQAELYNQSGTSVGSLDIPEAIFKVGLNPDLVHQVLLAQRANARRVIAHTKDRAQVRGGGKKPWKQKGTGRARHASIRSPIWKGGGVTFGPTKDRNFAQKINVKMKRKALFMVLSGKLKDKEILFLDGLRMEMPKTKLASQTFQTLVPILSGVVPKSSRKSILLITADRDADLQRATNNLDYVTMTSAHNLNIKDLLGASYVFVLKDAVPVIQKTYSM